MIANGTLPAQRTVVAPLAQIADAAAADLEPPALVVVGDVVALAHVLKGSLAAIAA